MLSPLVKNILLGLLVFFWGAEDLAARIDGPNESIDLREIERVIDPSQEIPAFHAQGGMAVPRGARLGLGET